MNLQNRLHQLERTIKPKPNSRPFKHLTDQQLITLADDELLEAIKQDPSQQSFYNELMHTIKMLDPERYKKI